MKPAIIEKKYEFVDNLIKIFQEEYLEKKGYTYDVVAIGKERSLAGKLGAIVKKKYPNATTKEAYVHFRNLIKICLNINDNFIQENMSLGIIVSQYNKIKTIARNGNKTGIKKGVSDNDWEKYISSHHYQK